VASVEAILLPDIGDFSEVEIIEILVAPGDRIEPDQSLLTLESDKATMEIPAPRGGVVREILVKIGDKVGQGAQVLTLESVTDSPADATAAAPVAATSSSPAATVAPAAPSAIAPRAAAATATVPVRLPDIGDYAGVPVIEILVAPGDRVEADQSVLTLESDKATMEIPSPTAGVVDQVAVKLGDKVSQGDLILTLRLDAGAVADQGASAGSSAPADPGPPASATAQDKAATSAQRAPGEAERRQAPVIPRPEDMAAIAKGRKAHASPTVRRFARELGVDLGLVKGSGPKGRVLREDVQGFVKRALAQGSTAPAAGALPFSLPAALEVDFARFGPVEETELSRIKKLSGRHLHRCWLSVPHVTQFDEADITELESFRKAQKDAAEAQGVKLTFLPFLLKAVATALDRMPVFKASLSADGERLILKRYTHIGVAVETPNGLLVPVVRDVDKKGIYDLARDLMELGKKARDGKLLPGDMQGGCFSVSSLGGIGGTKFTPIVNAPEVAILGVSRSETRAIWNGREFAPRLTLPLSLSYDHRVIDGADGARFTTLLRGLLGDIRRVLL
jgi:pyruvate dehydrogenase E2 component (dihydrolipoamide acetyltransferase)